MATEQLQTEQGTVEVAESMGIAASELASLRMQDEDGDAGVDESEWQANLDSEDHTSDGWGLAGTIEFEERAEREENHVTERAEQEAQQRRMHRNTALVEEPGRRQDQAKINNSNRIIFGMKDLCIICLLVALVGVLVIGKRNFDELEEARQGLERKVHEWQHKAEAEKDLRNQYEQQAGALPGEITWTKKLQDVLKLVDEHLTEEIRCNIENSMKAGRLHDILLTKLEKDPNSAYISIEVMLDAVSPITAALAICPSWHWASSGPCSMQDTVCQSKELANTPGMSCAEGIKMEAATERWSSSCTRCYVCRSDFIVQGNEVSPRGYTLSLHVDGRAIMCGASSAGFGASSGLATVEAGASDKEKKKPLHDFIWAMFHIPEDDSCQQGIQSFSEEVLSSQSLDNIAEKLSYISALDSNPENATAWLQLGKSVGDGGRVDNISYDKRGCFLKAVELNPQSSNAWFSLGGQLESNSDKVSINERDYYLVDCMIKAVEVDPQNGHAWHSLATILLDQGGVATVNGRSYIDKDCLTRALEEDPENADAWEHLGDFHGGGTVRGITYDSTECFIQAVEIDPDHTSSWISLGMWRAFHDGIKKDRLVQLLRLHPRRSLLWTHLGISGGGTVNGISYDAKQCFLRALELNPEYRYAKEGLRRLPK